VDQVIETMSAILDELKEMNQKLDAIKGSGENSLDDVCNSLTNTCKKIDKLDTTVSFGSF